jgi:hypothetical protein
MKRGKRSVLDGIANHRGEQMQSLQQTLVQWWPLYVELHRNLPFRPLQRQATASSARSGKVSLKIRVSRRPRFRQSNQSPPKSAAAFNPIFTKARARASAAQHHGGKLSAAW